MNNLLDYFYVFTIALILAVSSLGLWFSIAIPGLDRWNKRFFVTDFAVFFACAISCLAEMIFDIVPVSSMVKYIILYTEAVLLPLLLPLLTVYLLHCSGVELRRSRLFRAVLILLCLSYSIVVSSIFISGFFSLTPDNRYQRGPLYPIEFAPLVVIMLLNVGGTFRYRSRIPHKACANLLTAQLPLTAALMIHLFIDVFPLIDIGFSICVLSMFRFVLVDQIERNLRHQREIAEQRSSILVLQMRPHFILNTMTSIYCLCDQDPQQARQVILDFTTYLRKNFNAVAGSALVPFTSELEHTRAYLAVEQALYEDSLLIEYDTPHTVFRMPSLTLQPIVENSVKHGRDPDAGPLHISIRTRKTDAGSEIIVTDDGRGFDPAAGTVPNNALENIRQKLEIMCGGSMTIGPGEGGGTIVKVTIPDKATG